jgi:hypothetical protein
MTKPNELLMLICLCFTFKSLAYEQMSRHGYNSCVTCHNSPNGGGLLNEYGKVISGAFSLSGKEYKEGNFKKSIRLNKRMDYALHMRMANFRNDERVRTFPMQFDFLTRAKITKNTGLEVTIAKAPRQEDDDEEKNNVEDLYARRLLLTTKINNLYLQIGRDYHSIGFKQPDHTVYNRSLNKNNFDDLPTIIGATYYQGKYAHKAYVFTKSFQERNALDEEKGFSVREEFTFGKNNISLYGLYGETQNLKRHLIGHTLKIPFKSLLLLVENNFSQRKIIDSNTKFSQWTSMIQASYFLKSYSELYLRFEKASRQEPFKLSNTKYSMGFDYKFTDSIAVLLQYRSEKIVEKFEQSFISQVFVNLW